MILKTIGIKTDKRVQMKEVTDDIARIIQESAIENGVVHLFVPHTTAAITINENADPDVCTDMIRGLNKLVPFDDGYRHQEGNSAAHIKSSLIGSSEQLILQQGSLILGTWQGIYFCEFDGPRKRQLHINIVGEMQ